ncbi:MAG: hypothetical protein KBS59_00240 [Clostridiales bacterium]|nr:hypothetical protein [Clostridiales bacterium]
MSKYLLTQSLLSAWGYMHDCYEGCEDDAVESFISTLRREQTPTTEVQQNGIDFEDEVYKVSHGLPREPHPEWEEGIQAVAQRIKGAPNQIRVSRDLTVDGTDFLVYGKLDALSAGTIYDVKFSNKSFNSTDIYGKYLESPQHPTYFYCVPEANKFIYLVSDGKDLYTEEYTRQNTRSLESVVREFMSDVSSMKLFDTYREFWEARGD